MLGFDALSSRAQIVALGFVLHHIEQACGSARAFLFYPLVWRGAAVIGVGVPRATIGPEGRGLGAEFRPSQHPRVAGVADNEFVIAHTQSVAGAGVIEEFILDLIEL